MTEHIGLPQPHHVPPKKRPNLVIPIAAFLVVGMGIWLYAGLSGPTISDTDRLTNVLLDLSNGVGQQNVNGVFAHIDSNFHLGAMYRNQAKRVVTRFFHDYGSSGVSFRSPQIQISGNTATVVVETQVTGMLVSSSQPVTIYHNWIQLTFHKDGYQRLLLFPAYEWKLVNATVPNMPDTGSY